MLAFTLLVKMVISSTSVRSPGINGFIIVITLLVLPFNDKSLAVYLDLPKAKATKWHNEF